MDERVMRFRIGVMVIGAVLAAAILALMLGGLPGPFQRTSTIYVKLSSAPGVSVGTPVRKSGIRIGEVSNVALTADDQVLVTMQIKTKYRLYKSDACVLRTSLLGDAWLEFEPGKTADSNSAAPIGTQSSR
jgi:phospholipid/cholesterol/gamma-HCH transport system substrate-binding protein